MKSETITLAIALALAISLVAGLIVVPAMTDEAEAGCTPKNPNHKNGQHHQNH
jgi:hypothetical protein